MEDKSENILLLCDDENTLQAMQDVIEENFPHETISTTSTKAAAEIREQEITLIIAQADMKFIDGVKFLSLITSTERLSSIPFAITMPDKLLEVLGKVVTNFIGYKLDVHI